MSRTISTSRYSQHIRRNFQSLRMDAIASVESDHTAKEPKFEYHIIPRRRTLQISALNNIVRSHHHHRKIHFVYLLDKRIYECPSNLERFCPENHVSVVSESFPNRFCDLSALR